MPAHIHHRRARRGVLLLAAAAALACRDDPTTPRGDDARAYNPDWTAASHGTTAPRYAVAFPQDSVNTIEITLTAGQWAGIRANMQSLWGFDFGAGPGRAPGGPAPGPGAGPGLAPGPGAPSGTGFGFPDRDPDYVDATFTFNGKRWRNVGFRLKGNSSLAMAWSQGVYKLPFRLKFDEFEDRYPAIGDQRFYGFRELAFSAGTADPSLLREKLAADIFRLAGVPAARTAFYRVYIDFGEGLRYCGLYTAVEVIDDTMVAEQFGEQAGNLYKPESRLATFVEKEFEKKSNRAAADYSDVRAFVAALNSDVRATDAARWRAGLEATFDVDHFLKWLAVNNAIVNWDSYGSLAHNYYLYNHSARKLTWIPWDHDLSLEGSPGVTGTRDTATGPGAGGGIFPRTGGPGPGPGAGPIGPGGLSLTMNEVSSEWPLIRYLADDPVYFQRYRAHLKALGESVLTDGRVEALLDRYHALIAPHVVGERGEQPRFTHLPDAASFTGAPSQLKTHFRNRRAVLASFLR